MQARILTTTQRPPPWGDRPADWPVLLVPAHQRTRASLQACGVSLDGADGADGPDGSVALLLLTDDLLLSEEFVRAFLAVAGTRPGDRTLVACVGPGFGATRCAGRSSLPAGPDGSLPVPLIAWRRDAQTAPTTVDELLAAILDAEPIVVDADEKSHEVEVPRAYADPGKETLTIAGSRRIALHLRHRTHLLQANLDWMGRDFMRGLGSRPKWLLALQYLWQRLRPGPRRLFSSIGKGCRVHPTAIVEASTLGPGCEVGAFAIVQGSVLAAGAAVEDAAHVRMCILGENSRVGRQSQLFACLLQEGAHSTQGMMQLSTLGRHAATTFASWFIDVRLDGHNIRVEAPAEDGGGLVDSGSRYLGCDVGHETIVGEGVTIAAGRMLPSRATIVGSPARVAARLASDVDPLDAGGAVLTIRDGVLGPS